MKSLTVLLFLGLVALSQAGSFRYRRSPQDGAPSAPLRPLRPIPVAPSYNDDLSSSASNSYAPHTRGRVGPVYTFQKTDADANFKWGVRHVAGAQYGRK